MSILLVATDRDLTRLQQNMQLQLPEVLIQNWPDVTAPEQVEFAVLWRHPRDLLAKLPNLKVISSLGAGVDNILSDPQLPANTPVVRIVDDDLPQQMAEYVLSTILLFKCKHLQYFNQKQQQCWQPSRRNVGKNVAIMGLGYIGKQVAKRLVLNGFEVKGWRRSEQNDTEIACYHGQQSFNELLAWADYVVSVLPVTSNTQQLFSKSTFESMKSTAFFINVGRGELVNEADLVCALTENVITGACLDVFSTEPLPRNNPLWDIENLIITPHISAITKPDVVVNQLVNNYLAMKRGESLINTVDKTRGY